MVKIWPLCAHRQKSESKQPHKYASLKLLQDGWECKETHLETWNPQALSLGSCDEHEDGPEAKQQREEERLGPHGSLAHGNIPQSILQARMSFIQPHHASNRYIR